MTLKYKINQKYMLQSFIMTSLVLEYISPSTISLLWKYKKDIRVERREKKKNRKTGKSKNRKGAGLFTDRFEKHKVIFQTSKKLLLLKVVNQFSHIDYCRVTSCEHST